MANCGCKPCSKEMPASKTKCKQFSLCVGNKSLHYDGNCLFVTDRKYKIPDGTYTSITLKDGCIVGVDKAPLPIYTPQACCDGAAPVTEVRSEPLTVAEGAGNLAVIEGNKLTVDPVWKTTKSVNVSGVGTSANPWKAEVVLANQYNRIVATEQGLKVELEFGSSDTVKLAGSGTVADPYKFTVDKLQATLPEVNKAEVLGNGFTITKTGLFKTTNPDLELITNLQFSTPALTATNAGVATVISLHEDELVTAIIASPTALQKLKTALGI